MSFTLLVPADDSQPIVLRELSEGATISAQARQLFGWGFALEEAEQLRDRIFRRTGRGRG